MDTSSLVSKAMVCGFMLLGLGAGLSCNKDSDPTDPGTLPKVVFTIPDHGGVGPFPIYDRGDGSTRPHFAIRFNKYFDPYSVEEGAVTVTGFNKPVRVAVQRLYPYASQKANAFTDILSFDIIALDGQWWTKASYEVGKPYLVTVSQMLRDINGVSLAAPYQFGFLPEPFFRVVGVTPKPGRVDSTMTMYRSGVTVVFNSPIGGQTLSSLQLAPMLPGHWFIVSADSTYASFSLSASPAFATEYTIAVDPTAADIFGNRLGGDASFTFRTVEFRGSSSNPLHGSTEVSRYASIGVYFTGYIDTSTVRAAFSIDPYPGGSSFFYGSGNQFVMNHQQPFAPRTTHTVTVSRTLRAWDGTPLPVPFTFSFTTGD